MKKILAAALVCGLLAGCAPKNPTAAGTADSIPRIAYSSASSYVCTVTSVWPDSTTREAVLDARFRCKFKFFYNIDSGSDSLFGVSYLHNGRVFASLKTQPAATSDSNDASLKCLDAHYIFNSGSPYPLFQLYRSDSLTSVDSAVACFIWWYNGVRQTSWAKSP